jgi:hypothetical protein
MDDMADEAIHGRRSAEDRQSGPDAAMEGKGREAETHHGEHPMHKEIRAEHERHHARLHQIANKHLGRKKGEPKKEAEKHESEGMKRFEEIMKRKREHESEGMKKAMAKKKAPAKKLMGHKPRRH